MRQELGGCTCNKCYQQHSTWNKFYQQRSTREKGKKRPSNICATLSLILQTSPTWFGFVWNVAFRLFEATESILTTAKALSLLEQLYSIEF